MTKRICALAAALVLALTLTACGDTGSTRPDTSKDPDTTPNGNASTQPDTSGTDTEKDDIIPGDSMNGGHNADGGAVPGNDPERVDGSDASAAAETRIGRSAARRSRDAAAFDSDYQQMIRNGRVTDTDGFLDNDR